LYIICRKIKDRPEYGNPTSTSNLLPSITFSTTSATTR